MQKTLSDAVQEGVEGIAVDPCFVPNIVRKFHCQMCGSCCRGGTGFKTLHLFPHDIVRLSEGLGIGKRRVKEHTVVIGGQRHIPLPCPFLDGDLCGVHDHRPEACRDYPAGEMVQVEGKDLRHISFNCLGWGLLKEELNGH